MLPVRRQPLPARPATMFEPRTLADFQAAEFDEVIDVRSPSEFAEDHVIGAVNLPVLSDAQRSLVGRIYTGESRFRAKRVGAALVARNIADHLDGHLAGMPGEYRPLVYCWRGGERSGAMAEILGRVGWRVEALAGGYRSWRRLVSRLLYDTGFPARVILLAGNTGTAKTPILRQLAASGAQIIDLEALASHRGSLFGATGSGQPSQKRFESALAVGVDRLDPDLPVVIEAESSRIGQCQIPPSLWRAMQAAPRIELQASVEIRVANIMAEFSDLVDDPARLKDAILLLGPFHSRDRIAAWLEAASERRFEALVAELITHHYDPRYHRHRERGRTHCLFPVELTSASPDDIAIAARQIVSKAGLCPPVSPR